MKEWIYRYQRDGYYLDDLSNFAFFADGAQAVLTVMPCDYTLKVSGEVLHSAQYPGCRVEITDRGAAKFYDLQGKLLAQMPATEKQYEGFRLQWQPDKLTVCFGQMVTVDNYPNCDGERDRWEQRWFTEHQVTL